MKKALVFLPFLVAPVPALSAVAADDTLVQFRGGNGVIPVAASVGQEVTADARGPEHCPRGRTRRPDWRSPSGRT